MILLDHKFNYIRSRDTGYREDKERYNRGLTQGYIIKKNGWSDQEKEL